MILAIWGALRVRKGEAPLGVTLGRTGLVVPGIAAIVGAGIGLRLLTLDTYSNEAPPMLEFELRVPRTHERGWHQLGGRPRAVSSDGGYTALAFSRYAHDRHCL